MDSCSEKSIEKFGGFDAESAGEGDNVQNGDVALGALNASSCAKKPET